MALIAWIRVREPVSETIEWVISTHVPLLTRRIQSTIPTTATDNEDLHDKDERPETSEGITGVGQSSGFDCRGTLCGGLGKPVCNDVFFVNIVCQLLVICATIDHVVKGV